MNPLKKLKLKSQLRNCDYILAGTVIKQQYYDVNKSTVINGMIDEFMDNPGFDNALKLIEYNDMMVFYFTESCAGGLYVRKTAQDTARLSDTGSYSLRPSVVHERDAKDDYEYGESVHAEDDFVDEDSALVNNPEAERQKQALVESEAWMDEMIARSSRNKAKADDDYLRRYGSRRERYGSRFDDHDDSDFAETVEEESEEIIDETIRFEPIREDAPAIVFDEEQEAQWLPIVEVAPPVAESAEELVEEPVAELVADSLGQEEVAMEQSAATGSHDPFIQPAVQATPQQHIGRLRSYPNVIATLKIDIHTMMKQLEEYRRELSYDPFNEKQLISWIQSLEEAIEEFSEVVDILEDRNG